MFDAMKNSIDQSNAAASEEKKQKAGDAHNFFQKIGSLDRHFDQQYNFFLNNIRKSGIDYKNQSLLKIFRLRPYYQVHWLEPEIFCQTTAPEDRSEDIVKNFKRMKGYVSHSGSRDFEDGGFTSYEFGGHGPMYLNQYHGSEIYYYSNNSETFLIPVIIRYRQNNGVILRSRILIPDGADEDFLLRSILSTSDLGKVESHFEFGTGNRSPYKEKWERRWIFFSKRVLHGSYDEPKG